MTTPTLTPGSAAPAAARQPSPDAQQGARRRPAPLLRRRAPRAKSRDWKGGLRAVGLALPVPVIVLVLWHLGVRNAWTLPFGIQMAFVPTPGEVLSRMVDIAVGSEKDAFSGSLWEHMWASTGRVLSGFGIAAACAIPLGILMGRYGVVNRMFDPVVNLVRPVPVTAWAPLTLLIIGFGDRSTIFLVFLAAFFPILLNTIAGVRRVPVRLLEAAAMLGTKPAQVLYKVVLPSAMHSIVGGLRIALGLCWVILVVGETVGISVGLGSMITQARDMSKTDLIVAGMVVIGLAGFVADRLLALLVKAVTRGRPTLS
ncbi:ABC transporter permease [Cellulomonas chengniuliangii]|uniref:ABC transporter permease n=1 Tax=Cellulomonas chengniuliangii TaxID=2968084 RepID=A0ABY5L1A1_9CELL|nr:ABC transporter permease [Cellulomonas chengniuliangii]MCC2307491.1 ABC transporter permease [Cellulomonas chengniuliangii]UUI75735.1 ABC transporter permease [Cellulomonas chengniuliangii]